TLKKLKSIEKEANNLKSQKNYEDAVRKIREGITYIRLNIKEYDEREAEVAKLVEEIDQTYSESINNNINNVKESVKNKEFNSAYNMLNEITQINKNISDLKLKDKNSDYIQFITSEVKLKELVEQGNTIKSKQDFDKALQIFQNALGDAEKIYRLTPEIKEIKEIKQVINQTYLEKASSLSTKASELKQANKPEEAINIFNRAIDSCEKMDDSDQKNGKISSIQNQINEIYAEKALPLIQNGENLTNQNQREKAITELKAAEEIANKMYSSEQKTDTLNKIGKLLNPLLVEKIKPIKENGLEIIKKENYEESVNIVNEAATTFKNALDLGNQMVTSDAKTEIIEEISGLIDNVCTAGINVRKSKGQLLIEQKKYEEAVGEMYSALSIAKNMACAEEDNEEIEHIKNIVNQMYSGEIHEILEQGRQILAEKKNKEAMEIFNEALKISNKMYVSEEMDKVVKEINELLREAEIKKLVSEGSLMVQQKEFSKELEDLGKAMEDADKITDLTRKRVKIREIKDAIDQVHSKEIKFLNEQALLLTDQSKFAEAYVEFEKALEIAKTIDNEELQNEERINIIKLYTEELNSEAKQNLEEGNFGKAIECCEHAIDLDKDFPVSYYNMGNGYIGKEEFDKAIDFYQKAVDLAPNYVEAWCDMGLAYELKNDFDNALKSCKKALEINENYALGWYRIGNVYKHREEIEKAIESYKKATELNPKLAKAWLFLGTLFIQKKEFNEGIELCKKAIELNSEISEKIGPNVKNFDDIISSISENLTEIFKNKKDKY
ncbi:MAG: tetratricopeptide repeat protein, partial [Candidatus Hermodarchaeota archaeon]